MIARLKLELKNQRFLYWVPFVVVCILVPLMNYAYTLNAHGSQIVTRAWLIRLDQQYIPMFSIWWPIFIMKEYLNSPGNELLYVYRFGKDTLLTRMLALWGWYMAHWTVLCIVYCFLVYQVAMLYLLVAAQCFFLIALCYALAMLVRNTLLPLMGVVLYCLACLLFGMPLSIFLMDFRLEKWSEMLPAIVMVGAGVVLLAIGYQLEKRLFKDG